MQSAPQEVLDAIFSLIDKSSHLLPIALACKDFKNLIVPYHIDYRHIRCDITRTSTWKHLSENPRLASRVLTLEVIDEDDKKSEPLIVPRSTALEPRDTSLRPSQKYLVLAIRNMINLRKFVWKTLPAYEDAYNALSQSCPNLKALEVFCGGVNPDTGRPLAHLNVWPNFRDLKEFSYSVRLSPYGTGFLNPQVHEERLQAFIPLLQRNCPDLGDLQIDFCDWDQNSLSGLFQNVTWPNLKRLNIQAIFIHDDHLTLFPSLLGLQALSISDTLDEEGDNLVFNFTGLQSLQSLEIDCAPQLPLPIARNLTSLSFRIQSNPRPDEDSDIEDPFDDFDESLNVPEISQDHLDIIRDCSSLRNLVVKSPSLHRNPLPSILRVVPPALERLAYVGFSDTETGGDFFDNLSPAQLERLVNLTHLGFIAVHDETVPEYDSEEDQESGMGIALGMLSTVLPKLQFIGLAPMLEMLSWVKVERAREGYFMGYTKVAKGQYDDDVDFDGWGGHYRGVRPTKKISDAMEEEEEAFRDLMDEEDDYDDGDDYDFTGGGYGDEEDDYGDESEEEL